MPRFPTVLLWHEAPQGSHHDWLLVDPRTAGDPAARLWAARVGPPSQRWGALGAWELKPLPPHRREYLTYEGPLTPDARGRPRGQVRRVDEGSFTAVEWGEDRIVVDVELRHFHGRLELTPMASSSKWRARVVA